MNNTLNDEDESIVDKKHSEYEVEEDNSIAEENVLQDKMFDHYLDNYNVEGTPFYQFTSNSHQRYRKVNIT